MELIEPLSSAFKILVVDNAVTAKHTISFMSHHFHSCIAIDTCSNKVSYGGSAEIMWYTCLLPQIDGLALRICPALHLLSKTSLDAGVQPRPPEILDWTPVCPKENMLNKDTLFFQQKIRLPRLLLKQGAKFLRNRELTRLTVLRLPLCTETRFARK